MLFLFQVEKSHHTISHTQNRLLDKDCVNIKVVSFTVSAISLALEVIFITLKSSTILMIVRTSISNNTIGNNIVVIFCAIVNISIWWKIIIYKYESNNINNLWYIIIILLWIWNDINRYMSYCIIIFYTYVFMILTKFIYLIYIYFIILLFLYKSIIW